jgi:hypothetical protein
MDRRSEMGGKTKVELEAENAALSQALDAVGDVLDDDDLSASEKVVAATNELDAIEGDEDDSSEEDE